MPSKDIKNTQSLIEEISSGSLSGVVVMREGIATVARHERRTEKDVWKEVERDLSFRRSEVSHEPFISWRKTWVKVLTILSGATSLILLFLLIVSSEGSSLGGWRYTILGPLVVTCFIAIALEKSWVSAGSVKTAAGFVSSTLTALVFSMLGAFVLAFRPAEFEVLINEDGVPERQEISSWTIDVPSVAFLWVGGILIALLVAIAIWAIASAARQNEVKTTEMRKKLSFQYDLLLKAEPKENPKAEGQTSPGAWRCNTGFRSWWNSIFNR